MVGGIRRQCKLSLTNYSLLLDLDLMMSSLWFSLTHLILFERKVQITQSLLHGRRGGGKKE